MGYGLEVEMIAKAHAKDMLTTPYVFSEGEAEAMAHAGADIIVCHHGSHHRRRDRGGDGAEARGLPGAHRRLGRRGAEGAARHSVLAHGGPIAEPADADFIMKTCKNCHGFYGASSMERLPVETRADRAGAAVQGDRAQNA